jgi:hypothetical protein
MRHLHARNSPLFADPLPLEAAPHSPVPNRETEFLSLADMRSLEIMGSSPLWILAGLDLERIGWRSLESGTTVGIYHPIGSVEADSFAGSPSSED